MIPRDRPALDQLSDQVDRFLYDWQETGESSTFAARRLLERLFRSERLHEAEREFLDGVTKGINPLKVPS
jgi:hypothetical protein